MDDIKAMLQEISRALREDELVLNDWETRFLHGIRMKLNNNEKLSERQDECLVKIWRKALGEE
jgi:hypothetical protein